MKYIFYFFFLTFFYAHSQSGVINYNSVLNFGNAAPQETVNQLFFNQSFSLYKTANNDIEEKKTTTDYTYIDEHTTGKNIHQKYINTISSEYYFNLKKQTFICLETAFEKKTFQPYIYKDSIAGKMRWQLENDFKMISGYRCQKATTSFRGRNYTAWFSPKIPLPYGPWKLNGLPGLILEAYDDTKEVHFSANQITIPFNNQGQLKKPTAGKEIAFKNFIKKRMQESENVIKSIQARLPKGSKTVSTNIKRKGLELTYEWEEE